MIGTVGNREFQIFRAGHRVPNQLAFPHQPAHGGQRQILLADMHSVRIQRQHYIDPIIDDQRHPQPAGQRQQTAAGFKEFGGRSLFLAQLHHRDSGGNRRLDNCAEIPAGKQPAIGGQVERKINGKMTHKPKLPFL